MCPLTVRPHHLQCAQEGRLPASALGVWDSGSAGSPKLHKVVALLGNSSRARQCPGQRGAPLLLWSHHAARGPVLGFLCRPAHPHGVILHLSFPLSLPHPQDLTHAEVPLFPLFFIFFRTPPQVILRSPEGAAFQRFPFLRNVRSLVGSAWVISESGDGSIASLGFLLSCLEASSIIRFFGALILY